MPAPNPIWGLHLAAGALNAVCVERSEDGSFDVIEQASQPVAGDEVGAVRDALSFLKRKGVRGRAAFIALPDSRGCVVTAHLPPEDADLSGPELLRELYDHTPFEQVEARLDHREVPGSGRGRNFVVAGLPIQRFQTYVDVLGEGDFGLYGLGFAGSAVLEGSRALGLIWDETFLLELQPDLALLYANDGDDVHRYTLPFGTRALAQATATASGRSVADVSTAITSSQLDQTLVPFVQQAVHALAADVRSTVTYHRELHRRTGDEDAGRRGRVVPVGPHARSPNVAAGLAAALGGWFDDALVQRPSTLRSSDGVTLGAAQAGALGAALQGFAAEDDRLALRALPEEVPEFTESAGRSTTLTYVLAASLLIIAVIAFVLTQDDDPRTPNSPVTNGSSEDGPDGAAWAASPGWKQRVDCLTHRAALSRSLRAAAAVLSGGSPEFSAQSLVATSVEPETDTDAESRGWTIRLQLAPHENGPPSLEEAVQRVRGVLGEPAATHPWTVQLADGEPRQFVIHMPRRRMPAGPFEPSVVDQELVAELEATLALTGEGELLARTLAARAGSVPDWDPSEDWRIALSPDRIPMVLAGLVTSSGADRVVRIDVQPASEGYLLGLATRKIPAEPFSPTSLAASWGEPLRAELADCAPPALIARFVPLETTALPAGVRFTARRRSAGGVTLIVPPGPNLRVLERRVGDDGPWVLVPLTLEPGASEVDDLWLPGTGSFTWRVRHLEGPAKGAVLTTSLDVVVRTVAQLLADDVPSWVQFERGTARFALQLSFGGKPTRFESDPIRRGEPVVAKATQPDGTLVTIPSGLIFEGYQRSREPATRTIRVPAFRPDGTIDRDSSGAPKTTERQVEVQELVIYARLRTSSGESLTMRLEK